MDDSYSIVFRHAILCDNLRCIAEDMQKCKVTSVRNLWKDVYAELHDFVEHYASELMDSCGVHKGIEDMIANSLDDYAHTPAIIEEELIPMIRRYLAKYGSIYIEDDDYSILGTPSGFLNLRDNVSGCLVHSTSDPMLEAERLADSIYYPGMKEVYLFGAGLGYLAYKLWKKSDGMLDIYVYERSSKISEYGSMFGPLELIDRDIVHCEVIEDLNEYCNRFVDIYSDHLADVYLSYAERQVIESSFDGVYESVVINYNTRINNKNQVQFNRAYNLQVMRDHPLPDRPVFKDEWILVAAGPSLDDGIEFIRESIGNRTIVAVNRCISRFEKENIRPDMIAVCDSSKLIMPHIEGHEDFTRGIPLLANIESYCGFLKAYKGPIYIVDDGKINGENITGSDSNEQWNFAGTVMSFALEGAYAFGAKKVYLIGMDLGYPGGIQYSGNSNNVNYQNMTLHRSNDLGYVETTPDYLFFRDQISDQIKNHPDVEVWNMSKYGMYVPGTRTGKWWEEGLSAQTDITGRIRQIIEDKWLNWKEKYYLFRQIADNPQIKISDQDAPVIDELMVQLYNEMASEMDLSGIQLRIGNKLRVVIVSDESKLDGHITDLDPDIIINTRETLSGEKVYIKGALYPIETGISNEAESITISNRTYPYYKMPENMPSGEYYKSVVSFLASQNNVDIINTDPYSLFGYMCTRLSIDHEL